MRYLVSLREGDENDAVKAKEEWGLYVFCAILFFCLHS